MRINEKAKSKNIFLRKRVKFRFTKKSVCVCVLFFSTHTHTHKDSLKGFLIFIGVVSSITQTQKCIFTVKNEREER